MNLTVMVKYRALAQATPVLEAFRLGSIESIAREIRLSGDPAVASEAIRKALLRIVDETKDKAHAYRHVLFPATS